MKKAALFAGSFDPFTKGHLELVEKGSLLFDEVIIGIFTNTQKKSLLTPAEKKQVTAKSVSHLPNIEVIERKNGLTVEICKELGADFLLRGLRSTKDYEYERDIAWMNVALSGKVQTVFLHASPENAAISSTIVKEIYINNGDVSRFVPQAVWKLLEEKKENL